MNLPTDTPPEVERILIEGYRRMSPVEKMERVVALNHAVEQLARGRLRARYGNISEREMRLRLAALRLDAETMIKVFDWNPEVQGY